MHACIGAAHCSTRCLAPQTRNHTAAVPPQPAPTPPQPHNTTTQPPAAGSSNTDALFDRELKKYDTLKADVAKNVASNSELLAAIARDAQVCAWPHMTRGGHACSGMHTLHTKARATPIMLPSLAPNTHLKHTPQHTHTCTAVPRRV
jgi:hypothetical protein